MKPTIILALLGCLLLAPLAAQDASSELTLAQCIDAALSQGLDSQILKGNLEVSQAQYGVSQAANSFALSGSLGYGASFALGDDPLTGVHSSASSSLPSVPTGPQVGLTVGGPLTSIGLTASPYLESSGQTPTTSAVGLAVNQTLWDGYPGGRALAAVQKSLLSLQGKQLSTQSSLLTLTYRIKQAYYTMLGSQRDLSVKKQILDQQNSLLQQIQAVYDLKQASEVDLRTAQINAKSAEIDVQSAEHDLRISRIRLADLMALPRDKEFSVSEAEDPTVPVASEADAVSEGLKNRTELKQIDLLRQSCAIDLALIKGQATPTVSVSGGVSWTLDWMGENAESLDVGVKLGMPILDAGLVKNQVQANLAQGRVYDLQASQLQETIVTDIEEAYEVVQIQMEKLEVAKLSAEKYDIQFKLVETKRQFGTATNQDVLNASVDSANAQSVLAKARRDAQLSVLQLQSLMGY